MVVAISVVFFLMTWAGSDNGPLPWGDPIPFSEALRQLPAIVAFVCALVGIAFVLSGVRGNGPHE